MSFLPQILWPFVHPRIRLTPSMLGILRALFQFSLLWVLGRVRDLKGSLKPVLTRYILEAEFLSVLHLTSAARKWMKTFHYHPDHTGGGFSTLL